MKRCLLSVIIIFSTTGVIAQKNRYISLGFYNTQTAMPFGKFAGLFGEILHPGIEIGYEKSFPPNKNMSGSLNGKFPISFTGLYSMVSL